MYPDEFFYKFNSINKIELFEIRVRSLAWMLECYENGTIRKKTIMNLIPLSNLQELLKYMEDFERYEDCIIIKKIIDNIYES